MSRPHPVWCFALLLGAAAGGAVPLAWEKVRGPEGGDIQALASWGDTVVAAASQGDYHLSTDAGRTWSLLRREMYRPAQGLNWARDPVRIGDRLVGASTEGGLLILRGNRVDRVMPFQLFGATPNGLARIGDSLVAAYDGVYLSVDSGSTWTPVGGMPEGNGPILAMAQTRGYLVALNGDMKVHASGDLGRTWASIEGLVVSRYSIAGMLGTPDGVFAWWQDGTFLHLKRIGTGWTFSDGSLPGGPPHNLYARPSGLWVLSSAGIHVSHDNGGQWIPRAAPTARVPQSLAVLPAGGILAGTSEGIFAWDSLARAWHPSQAGLRAVDIKSLVKRGPDLVAMGTASLHRSRDGGSTWRPIRFPSGPVPQKLFPLSPDVLVGADSGRIYPVGTGDSVGGDLKLDFPTRPVDLGRTGNHWLVMGETGSVWVSHDGRKTWTHLRNSLWMPSRTRLNVHGARMMFLFRDSLHYSTDSGHSWKSAVPPSVPWLQFTVTGKSWFAVGDKPYRTEDPAKPWIPLTLGLSQPLVWTLLADEESVHALTDLGYYRSEDQGATWESRFTGMQRGEYETLQSNATTLFAKALDGGWWVAGIEEGTPVSVRRPDGAHSASARRRNQARRFLPGCPQLLTGRFRACR